MSALTAATEILARLRTIPNVAIYDEAVPDEAHIPKIQGTDSIVPHLTVSFSGQVRGSRRNDGIAGAALNGREMDTVIRAVASNPGDCRKLLDICEEKLLGFVPTNCGELDVALYGSTGQISGLAQPTRYAGVQVYTCIVNSDKESL